METTIRAKHTYTVMQGNNGFTIAKFEAQAPVSLPDGKRTNTVTVKGMDIPHDKGVIYDLTGEFQPFTKDGKTTFTLNVVSVKEIIPTDEEAAKAYLLTLKGVGKTTAERLYDAYGLSVFKIIENEAAKLTEIKGISKAKAMKIQQSFLMRQSARELFEYLYKFGVKNSAITKIHMAFGDLAVQKIKDNPYSILEIASIGFKTADAIARSQGVEKNNPERVKAGIVEVLMQQEKGGELFNKLIPFPNFMLDKYLRKDLFNLLYEDSLFQVGGTYMSRDSLYLMSLKLLETPVSETAFDDYLYRLHTSKKIFVSLSKDNGEGVKVYRHFTAVSEYQAAKKISQLLSEPPRKLPSLLKTVVDMENKNHILLSDEQRSAVIKAIENPISIITGGPGTGKTSIQKIILSVFKNYFPNSGVLLCAPTGKAAKRMSEQTGYPAQTIHKALGLYGDDEDGFVEADSASRFFDEGLILIDETSMVGSHLLNSLLSKVSAHSRIVFIGDVDQLPSIEVGACLRELINSEIVPTTRLTLTFRQADGSSIVTNSARIKKGEEALEYNDDFVFIECETSEAIAEKAAELMPKFVKK